MKGTKLNLNLPNLRPRASRQGLCLADNDGEHGVNTNFESATKINVIQPAVGFKPPIQALDTDSSIVDHLPMGGLGGSGECLLVTRIGVNNCSARY